MGNLLPLASADRDFLRDEFLLRVLNMGGSVRDVVRFALACKTATAVVCTLVRHLPAPALDRLLLTVPWDEDEEERDPAILNAYFCPGHFCWAHTALPGGETVALVELLAQYSYGNTHMARARRYYVACHPYISFYLFAPSLWQGTCQWYPLLDGAILDCIARIRPSQQSKEAAEDTAHMNTIKRVREGDDDDELTSKCPRLV
jgi:hypothetical protein